MTDLRAQVERHEYVVDSHEVAEEMIRRMRMARWARRALVNGGAGSRRENAR